MYQVYVRPSWRHELKPKFYLYVPLAMWFLFHVGKLRSDISLKLDKQVLSKPSPQLAIVRNCESNIRSADYNYKLKTWFFWYSMAVSEEQGHHLCNNLAFIWLTFWFSFTGKTISALNMGSYNYLGFAENRGTCADSSEHATRKYGLATCSTKHELGTIPTFHRSF